MTKIICFDLEGPLSPQDNAYEVMGLVDRGHEIFEVISRYDDLLALEGRKNYEAGDTLALIAPFLVYHEIKEEEIRKVSDTAKLVLGANELISKLKDEEWKVYIISTSYEQHAYNIGNKVGVDKTNIRCTRFPLDEHRKSLQSEDFSLIEGVESDILKRLYPPTDDAEIKRTLDDFFFKDLPKTKLGEVIADINVVGGQRKVDAASNISKGLGKNLSDLVVVGDSITDLKMLKTVNEKGGLSIVFNGNAFAIPYATISLATTNMMNIAPILEQWEIGGKEAVEGRFKHEKDDGDPYLHLLAGRDSYDDIIDIHKKVRNIVRGKAGKLG
jgi:energy-converting hydrogenase A subunit R